MDIRTKFVFALVLVALLSMAALGSGMYQSVERELLQSREDQLVSLAEFKQTTVDGILDGWHDRVSLVSSRTQLRASLDAYNRTGDPATLARVQGILSDAEAASPLFRQLAIVDLAGDTLAVAQSAGELAPADSAMVAPSREMPDDLGPRGTFYTGVTFRQGADPTVHFTAVLLQGDAVVGRLLAALSTAEIERLTGNYIGLGATGETLVVVEDMRGRIRALHPLRDAPPFPDTTGFSQDDPVVASPDPARRRAGYVVADQGPSGRAVGGDEMALVEGLDYRGELVWASTRFIDETGWGLIVKIDADEQAAPIDQFFRDTIWLAIVWAAYAIAFGTLFGLRFAEPILVLSEAADKLGEGDFSVRAKVKREDEVGHLARTFNEMAEELETQVGLLHQFRRFFDVSIDMMCIAATDGYFKKVNSAFVRELGWPEEELLARSFLSFVHPDDVDATVEEITSLAQGSLTIQFENRFQCMDGSYKRLRWNSYPEPDGSIYAIARVQAHDRSEPAR